MANHIPSYASYALIEDKELEDIVRRLSHRTMISIEHRIMNELDKRAACGGLSESGKLAMAALRDRLCFQRDLALYKQGKYTGTIGV